jgi:hypothetical protein
MRTKSGIVLNDKLLRQARSLAAREGKRLNQIFEEALAKHLERKAAFAE